MSAGPRCTRPPSTEPTSWPTPATGRHAAHGRDSAYIAIHQYVGLPHAAYFAVFESIVAGVGGRPHWGKLHTLDAARLRELYPRFGDFVRARDEADPAGRFTNPYLNRVLGPPPGTGSPADGPG